MAAQWLQPIARQGESTLLSGQRDLSEAERRELQRCARRIWVRPLPFVIGLTLWLCMPIATLLTEGGLHSRADGFTFTWLTAITLWTDVRWIRCVLLARTLARDAQEGRLLIIRTENVLPPREATDEEGEKEAVVDDMPALDALTVEILPTSRWAWTEDGRPAAWRTVRS